MLATYGSEFYKGMPALTVNEYGKGKAYYQACRDTGEMWDDTLVNILDTLDIKPILEGLLPEGVVVTAREDGDKKYLFVQNFSETPVTVDLENCYTDMESGKTESRCSLNAFDVKIYKN